MQKKNCRKPTRFAQPRPGSHSHGPRNQWRPLTFISFDRRFLISLSNLTFQHWFSILPGNSKHQKRLSSTTHYPPSTIHQTQYTYAGLQFHHTDDALLAPIRLAQVLKSQAGPRHPVYPHSAQDQGLSQILTIRLSLSFGWWHNTCP